MLFLDNIIISYIIQVYSNLWITFHTTDLSWYFKMSPLIFSSLSISWESFSGVSFTMDALMTSCKVSILHSSLLQLFPSPYFYSITVIWYLSSLSSKTKFSCMVPNNLVHMLYNPVANNSIFYSWHNGDSSSF